MTSKLLTAIIPVLLASAWPAVADEPPPLELDPLVVVSSKTPRPLSGVAGQVTIIDAADIELQLAENLDDLFRYEPGVEAQTGGTRFGLGGFTIRGLGGNRVAIEVDGVPLRNGFAVGSYSNAGRALLDTDRVKRVEILHGPASALYGSNALGGVLAFTTWDPDDLLARGSGNHHYSLRAGYQDAADASVGSGLAAWGSGAHGLLLSAAVRSGHELQSSASTQEPDRQDWNSADYALRYTFDTPGGHRLRLGAEAFQLDRKSQIASLPGYGRFASTTALAGDDRDDNAVVMADFSFSGGIADLGLVRAFATSSQTRQATFEERAAARVPVSIERYFEYANDATGMEVNLFREVAGAAAAHRLGAGLELLRSRIEEFRDGMQTFLASGESTRTVLGEELPVRDFPNSVTDEYSLFLQDEIALPGGWELIPALRWERYELHPRPDAIYLEDNPASPVVSVSEQRLNPRLGVVWRVSGDWSAYGQYTEGFRAPPFEDANIGLDIPLFNIRALPNPDLRSETSRGFEFGLRRLAPGSSLSLAWFDTDYRDFIESRALIGSDPDSGVLLFQSRNIGRASIHGLDLRLSQELGNWRESLRGLELQLAAFWSEGENLDNGQALNSISPPQAVIGLLWRSADARFDVNLAGTFTRAQSEIDSTDGPRFATDGHGVLDLTAGWQVSRRTSLRAAVFNLGDQTYWRWSDVANLAADDPMIPLLARPGRNFSVSARMQW